MSRPSLSANTPCPAPSASSLLPIPSQNRRLSALSTNCGPTDETLTTELEYTRAIQQEFQNARPRRRATFARKPAAVTIFEDVIEGQEVAFDAAKTLAGKTLLSKPAQRIPGNRLSMTLEKDENQLRPLTVTGQARKRSSILPIKELEQDEPFDIASGLKENKVAKGGLKKDPRRRTIFVPSDDTTMFTIHPGATTSNKLDDTFQLPNLNTRAPMSVAAQISDATENSTHESLRRPRRPRMSLAAPPKRVPLQHIATNENNVPSMDVTGQNGGKENKPPGYSDLLQTHEKPVKTSHVSAAHRNSSLFAPTAASQARNTVNVRKAVPLTASQSLAISRRRSVLTHQKVEMPRNPLPKHKDRMDSTNQSSRDSAPRNKVTFGERSSPNEINAAKRLFSARSSLEEPGKKSKLLQYPVLYEDVQQPELYEDSWLSQQEIALTQLVNEVFHTSSTSGDSCLLPGGSLREQMLKIYHQQDVTNIYKRLQASLLYGALSRPKDGPMIPSPAQDIGLRKRFLGLWLDNYDEASLRAAAEVVVGRQIVSKPRAFEASERILDPSRMRRALAGFIETFFISVEDFSHHDGLSAQELDEKKWRRMILRSLMMIWVLDQAKVSKVVTGCLFKKESSKKSSLSILNTFACLLMPFVGDISRSLRNSEYDIGHIQDPIDEIAYRVDNIAVDFRDGVFLVRLVEVLLFAPDASIHNGRDYDSTVTIVLPDSTQLESALWQSDGSPSTNVLSQHVKLPCLGRAQKLHNVQVALSALDTFSSDGERLADYIAADDIVDGHREKTLHLLWSLISNYGLGSLIDWDLLAMDTRLAGGEVKDIQSRSKSVQDEREQQLMNWVTAYGAKKNAYISNWTTSFADGQAYKALLSGFAAVLPAAPASTKPSLAGDEQLLSLGCSSTFIKQLSSGLDNAIPTKTTTVSNVAFLASKLLPLKRRHHAATTIQRAFRRKNSKTMISRRVVLMRLAHACATVVQTQDRLISAATTLQRAWRGVLDTRITRLNQEVAAFQAVARGWSMRKHARRALGTQIAATWQPERSGTGW